MWLLFSLAIKSTLPLSLTDSNDNPFPSCRYKNYHDTLEIGQYTVDFLDNGAQSCYRGSFLLGGKDFQVTAAIRSTKDKTWNYSTTYPNAAAILLKESDNTSIFKIECISGVTSCKIQIAKIMPSYKKDNVYYRTYISTVKNGNVNFEYSTKKVDGYFVQYQGVFLNLNKRKFTIDTNSTIKFNQSGLSFDQEKFQYSGIFDTVHLKPQYDTNSQTTVPAKLSISYSPESNNNPSQNSDIIWLFPEITSFIKEGTSICPQNHLDDEDTPAQKTSAPYIIVFVCLLVVIILLVTAIVTILVIRHKKEKDQKEVQLANSEYKDTAENLLPDA